MEQTYLLGTYSLADRMYGVVLSGRGQTSSIRCFLVRPEQQAGQSQSLLAIAANQCLRQAGVFEQASAAVRCALFTQYRLHSDFSDARQIESTVRYDAEEAAVTDATNLAITFEVNGQDQSGSDLTVYTASRQAINDMLLDLQAGGLDPAFMEPDTVCLARVLRRAAPQLLTERTAVVMVFAGSCYILLPSKGDFAFRSRTFVLGDSGDPASVLAGQLVMTASAENVNEPLENIVLIEPAGTIDPAVLKDKTLLDVKTVNLAEALCLQLPADAGAEDVNGFVMACGAAFAFAGRGRKADFRKDFMPYQGRKRLVQNSLRVLSISLSVLLLVFAVSFQLKVFRVKSDSSRQQDKLVGEYKAAMYGKNPVRGRPISSKLREELNRVQQIQKGFGPGDEQSITSRLTFVLEAINKTPKTVDVRIEQISISERSVTVIGDTNSRAGTREMLDEIKKHPKLNVSSESLGISGARDRFTITIKPSNQG